MRPARWREFMDRQVQLVDPLLAKHAGRIVKMLGDGFLAEFSSVVNAVHFAVDVQAACEAATPRSTKTSR